MERTDINTWRIYNIMVDRFYNPAKTLSVDSVENEFLGGNLEGVISKLPYIKKLGFNAIMLSPVLKTHAYHGYHTTDFDEIDEHFGSWDVFYQLVNQAHSNGIAVIADCVLNHCHYSNPVFQNALNGHFGFKRDWFFFNGRKSNEYTSFMNLPDLPKFNLNNADAECYIINKVIRLAETGIDGIRIDHAIGLPFTFLYRLSKTLHRMNPDIRIIGEAWGQGCTKELMGQFCFRNEQKAAEYLRNGIDQESLQQDYIGVLDGVLDFRFRDIILGEIREGRRIKGNKTLRKKLIEHFKNYPLDFNLVLFMDNHDTNRVLYECGQDETLMMEIIEEMQSLCRPFSIYYGTECLMTNSEPIYAGIPYADLRVRTPMDWSKEIFNILNLDNVHFRTISNMNTTDYDRIRNSRQHSQEYETVKWLPKTPHWKLSSIIASDDLRLKLQEISVFMQNLETIKTWGLTRFRPEGVSYVMNFYGPAGTGKSVSAEALANECGLGIIKVSYSELQSSKWGGTEQNLTSLFESAQKHNAMIIFNEADYIFSTRKSDGPNSEVNNMIKAHLLNLLDSYEVMMALTTNRFFDYDDAFYRRTLFQVNVPLPKRPELMKLAKFHLGTDEEEYREGGIIPKTEDFSFESAVETLEGLSGGDIARIATNCMARVLLAPEGKLNNQMLKDEVNEYYRHKSNSKNGKSREVTGKEKEDVLKIAENY